MTDTIVAQATPPGRGGVAIVRVSGPKVKKVIQSILHQPLSSRKAHYLPFFNHLDEKIDEGIAIFFANPHSFTGEDVLELHAHGGVIIIDQLLESILTQGVRLAKPGEFSERAFLNGKLDLAQAEGIADLINASSRQAAKAALRSLVGDFSAAINNIADQLLTLRINVEVAIDFSDEEINFLDQSSFISASQEILHSLTEILKKSKQGTLLQEGFTAVIAGDPNVGKSSLLNKLSQKEVAIVTDIPGTTRDLLKNQVLIDGIPMHLIDTAGIRKSDDIIEMKGIKKAFGAMENADIILYLYVDECFLNPEIKSHQSKLILVKNKIDLINETSCLIENKSLPKVSLSVKTGEGLDLLNQAIKSKIGFQDECDGLYLARRRHLEALSQALFHLEIAINYLNQFVQFDMIAEELRLSHQALGQITGMTTSDDLLGHIFSSFCIGK